MNLRQVDAEAPLVRRLCLYPRAPFEGSSPMAVAIYMPDCGRAAACRCLRTEHPLRPAPMSQFESSFPMTRSHLARTFFRVSDERLFFERDRWSSRFAAANSLAATSTLAEARFAVTAERVDAYCLSAGADWNKRARTCGLLVAATQDDSHSCRLCPQLTRRGVNKPLRLSHCRTKLHVYQLIASTLVRSAGAG